MCFCWDIVVIVLFFVVLFWVFLMNRKSSFVRVVGMMGERLC